MIDALVAVGTTVLLTTQYLEEADRLARDIVVIDHGRVIAKGTPAALKADLGSTVLELTLESTESASSAATSLADLSTKAPRLDGPTVGLTVEAGPAVAAEALRRIDAAGFERIGLNLHEPSLDDVFLALTGRKAEVDTDAIAQTSDRKSRRTKETS